MVGYSIIYLKIKIFYQKSFILPMKKALKKSIYENIYFKNTTYNSHCFFHFSQMIWRKLISFGLASVKLNKLIVEILRNVEYLWFIEIKKIGKFKKILVDDLSKVNTNKNKNFLYIFK